MKSIVIIIAVQVLVALPFVLGDTPVKTYIEMSKLTGQGRNGRNDAPVEYDYLAAVKNLSIFYTWIPDEIYYDKKRFADRLFPLMILVNIWHFFVRKWCLPKCLENLFNTFDFKKTEKLGIKT